MAKHPHTQLIEKYTLWLTNLKENRTLTCDTNTDAENHEYDELIKYVAEFIRDLKRLQVYYDAEFLSNLKK